MGAGGAPTVVRRLSGGGPTVVRWWRWSDSGPAVVRQWSDVPMGASGAPTVVRRWSDGGPVVGVGSRSGEKDFLGEKVLNQNRMESQLQKSVPLKLLPLRLLESEERGMLRIIESTYLSHSDSSSDFKARRRGRGKVRSSDRFRGEVALKWIRFGICCGLRRIWEEAMMDPMGRSERQAVGAERKERGRWVAVVAEGRD
ncbi:hypothetical protein LXL04_038542 [Taraxacum kok-saghyz]